MIILELIITYWSLIKFFIVKVHWNINFDKYHVTKNLLILVKPNITEGVKSSETPINYYNLTFIYALAFIYKICFLPTS